MGWTGGYVLLALLLAPYLRKFGKFTVPGLCGRSLCTRRLARLSLRCGCAIFVSFTYIAGQMRGVGVVFSAVSGSGHRPWAYSSAWGWSSSTRRSGWHEAASPTRRSPSTCVLIFAYHDPRGLSGHLDGPDGKPRSTQQRLGRHRGERSDGVGSTCCRRLDRHASSILAFTSYTAAYVAGKKSMLDVVCHHRWP